MVTSTTLLANGMAFESAVAAGKQFHRLGIGVHLNLSEAEPVAGAAVVPTLVEANGRLYMVTRYVCGRRLPPAVRACGKSKSNSERRS